MPRGFLMFLLIIDCRAFMPPDVIFVANCHGRIDLFIMVQSAGTVLCSHAGKLLLQFGPRIRAKTDKISAQWQNGRHQIGSH